MAGGNQPARNEGQPLPQSLQHQFETSFGQDLSQVRVHTQHEQQATLLALGAQAFAVGNDIYFGAGQYQPFSPEGQRVVAHEVWHVVQQGTAGGSSVPEGMAAASSGGDAEAAAAGGEAAGE